MTNKHIKNAYHLSWRKCKWNQQWNTSTYLLAGLESNKNKIPSAKNSFISDRNTNLYSHFGRHPGTSYKVKYIVLLCDPAIHS